MNLVEGEWIPKNVLILSSIALPIEMAVSHTFPIPPLRPLMRPEIMSLGMLSDCLSTSIHSLNLFITFVTEFTNPDVSMPSQPAIFSTPVHTVFPISARMSPIRPAPALSPLISPLTMSLGTLSDCLRTATQFRIAVIAFFTNGTIFSNSFVKSKVASIQSLNFTTASPIAAVTSKMSRSNIARREVTALKANLKAPPRIVVMMSIIANTPFKVRFNLSAVSSPTLSFLENSFIEAMMLYSWIDVIGGNISTHASFIALNTATRP